MSSPPPPIAVPRDSSPVLRAGVLGGWLLFTLMVIAISWGGNIARGRPTDVGGMLLWNLGWLLWAPATFVVARLARRFPIERRRVLRGSAMHAGFGVAVGVGLLGGEFLLAQGIQSLGPGAPRANPFLGFIIYKFHVYFLIYWMLHGATRAHDVYSQLRETELRASQLEARLAQAQLHALQAQLHPHFLFNTHHAIISLMLKQDNAAAIRMLTRLSDLLRMTLRQTDQQLSSVRDELEALELYLGIQRERYGPRLDVHLEIEPAALSAQVPWLLLQPLVENALKHGIDQLAANGRVRIGIARDGPQLHVTVADNGPGFPAGFEPAKATRGIGLSNTHARLDRLYGREHRLECGAGPHGGAEVRITIPWRDHAPSHA